MWFDESVAGGADIVYLGICTFMVRQCGRKMRKGKELKKDQDAREGGKGRPFT
jgi:hypothetical protein